MRKSIKMTMLGVVLMLFIGVLNVNAQDREQDYGVYFRNNTGEDFSLVSISRTKNGSSSTTIPLTFDNNLRKGLISGLFIVPSANRKEKYNYAVTISNSSGDQQIFNINGKRDALTSPTSFNGQSIKYHRGNKNLYITVSNNDDSKYFGGLDLPGYNEVNPNELIVTSYNVYLGRNTKPDNCSRAKHLRETLEELAKNTDVLILQEMNTQNDGCADALELVQYLWNNYDNDCGCHKYPGATQSDRDRAMNYLHSDQARNGDNGKVCPEGNGAFKYVSQFTSGANTNNHESSTGGDIILSHYPLEMVRNKTFNNLSNDGAWTEEKGYIIAKITKGEQDYYILNTHTQKSDNQTVQGDQINEIKRHLEKDASDNNIPNGARVIVGGDWNCDLMTESNGVAIKPILKGFDQYPTAGDDYGSAFTFFGDGKKRYDATVYKESIGEPRTIDWILACTDSRYEQSMNVSNVKFFPVRNTEHKHVDLSDHLAVTATFAYSSPPRITYKVEMNTCHSSIDNAGSSIAIEFWAGSERVNVEGVTNPNCPDDLIFEITTSKDVTHILVRAIWLPFYIDFLRFYKDNELSSRYGGPNGAGWCISPEDNIPEDWVDYTDSCHSTKRFNFVR